MYIGHSSSRGMVVGNTAWSAPNAVYGCWHDGKIVLQTGEFKELKIKQDEDACEDMSAKNNSVQLLFGVAGLFLLFSVAVWCFFGFMNFLAALIFSILAYFPLMIIIYSRQNPYQSDEIHQQFCRYHGCEHAIVQLLSKSQSVDMEHLLELLGKY